MAKLIDATDTQLQALADALQYWTQYATYYSDEGFYEELMDAWRNIDIDIDYLVETLSLAPQVSDRVNQIIFDELWVLDEDKLDRIKEVLEAADMGITELADVVGFDFYELDDVLPGETWYEIVDADLKENGLDSRWTNLVDDLVYKVNADDTLYQINGYQNELTQIDKVEVFDDYDGYDLVADYIKG